MKIIASSISKKGSRAINQDACDIVLHPHGGCMAVCDGLGKYDDSGQVANICVKSFTATFAKLAEDCSCDLISNATALKCLGNARNNVLYRLAGRADSRTTLAGVLLSGDKAIIVNIGDTRVYRITDGIITYVTEDHSLAQKDVKSEKISRYEIASHKRQNVLTKSIGLNTTADADIKVFNNVTSADKFLICSDGLWTAISEREMEEIAASAHAPSFALKQFDRYITGSKNPSQDNYTAVLCSFID